MKDFSENILVEAKTVLFFFFIILNVWNDELKNFVRTRLMNQIKSVQFIVHKWLR